MATDPAARAAAHVHRVESKPQGPAFGPWHNDPSDLASYRAEHAGHRNVMDAPYVLMLAVFEQARLDARPVPPGLDGKRLRDAMALYAEARAWFAGVSRKAADAQWPFSFGAICEAFDQVPEVVYHHVLAALDAGIDLHKRQTKQVRVPTAIVAGRYWEQRRERRRRR